MLLLKVLVTKSLDMDRQKDRRPDEWMMTAWIDGQTSSAVGYENLIGEESVVGQQHALGYCLIA